MIALPQAVAERVGKIIGRLGSNHDGEVVAAGRALVKTLEGAGLGITDLAEHLTKPPETRVVYRDRPAPIRPGPRDYGDWRPTWSGFDTNRGHKAQVARVRAAPPGFLSPWETEFTSSLARQLEQGHTLTPKQARTLTGIMARFERAYG